MQDKATRGLVPQQELNHFSVSFVISLQLREISKHQFPPKLPWSSISALKGVIYEGVLQGLKKGDTRSSDYIAFAGPARFHKRI